MARNIVPQADHKDVYQLVTDKIIAQLEQGTIPWHKPWKGARNLMSNREYRGINALLLGTTDYTSPYWLTLREANALGGHVCKGEHSTLVVFWKWTERTVDDPDTGEEKTKRSGVLRYYLVFNLDQTEGVRIPKRREDTHANDPVVEAEMIVAGMPNPPTLQNKPGAAYYMPSRDLVSLPALPSFDTAEAYYSTLFHELPHSTGHASRCARGIETNAGFGSESYSKEELVAELGAAFLSTRAGIERGTTLANSASYIQSWLRALREDRKLLVHAAGAAQRAADYILNRQATDTQPTTTNNEEDIAA